VTSAANLIRELARDADGERDRAVEAFQIAAALMAGRSETVISAEDWHRARSQHGFGVTDNPDGSVTVKTLP
jgi:hypothetical protein